MRFLHECLEDLDNSLKEYGTRLHCIQGKNLDVLANLFKVIIASIFLSKQLKFILKVNL